MKGVYSMDENGTYDIGISTVEELINGSDLDFLIMNDYTQAPVRSKKKEASMEALRTSYIPMLNSKPNPPTVIFIQTAAYKSPVKNSNDLGSFEEFTDNLLQGYEEYAELIRSTSGGNIHAKVAPFGLAHRYVKEMYGNKLWESLYHWDVCILIQSNQMFTCLFTPLVAIPICLFIYFRIHLIYAVSSFLRIFIHHQLGHI